MTSTYDKSIRDMTPGIRNVGFSPMDRNLGSPDYYASPDYN